MEARLEELVGLTFTGRFENKRKVYGASYGGAEYKIVEVERREETGLA